MSARRLLAAGCALAGAGFVAVAGVHLANEFVLDRAYGQLNADTESFGVTWSTGFAALAAAAAAFALAGLVPERRRTVTWIAGLLAFLAVDDLTGFHEDLGTLFALVGLPNIGGIWFPIYVPVLGATFALLWLVGGALAAPGIAVRAGLVLLALALAGEVAAAASVPGVARGGGWGYALEVAFEEGGELAGWLLIATGLYAARPLFRGETSEAAPAAVPAQGAI